MWRNLYVLIIMGLLELALAQRPSFAGQRPPGGLTQTDKYHGTKNTAVENNTGVDIATRFGADAATQQTSITLPYGASQRPPVGVPLVFASSNFAPNPGSVAPTAIVAPTAAAAPVEFANRIDGIDNSVNRPIASSTLNSVANGPSSSALPIDAHGDREYVNYLSQLPVDNQPFWFINYQAIEALRNSSRPNVGALETRGSFFGG